MLQRSSYVSALAHMTKVFKQSDKSKNVSGAKAKQSYFVLQNIKSLKGNIRKGNNTQPVLLLSFPS